MNRFGLSEPHWQTLERIVFDPLRNANCVSWIFGSRARGDHRPFSDLDVLISGSPPPPLLAQIREDLEESTLPIHVDLVLENELADSYRDSAQRDRVAL